MGRYIFPFICSLFIYSLEWAFHLPQQKGSIRAAHFNVILSHVYFLRNIEKQQQILPSLFAGIFMAATQLLFFPKKKKTCVCWGMEAFGVTLVNALLICQLFVRTIVTLWPPRRCVLFRNKHKINKNKQIYHVFWKVSE